MSGGPIETGSVEDGSMVVGVDWSGPCTGSVPCGVVGSGTCCCGMVGSVSCCCGVVGSVSCCCVVVGSSSCCVVVGVVVVIGGGVCVGTCVEVGEGDGVEGVVIITGSDEVHAYVSKTHHTIVSNYL